MATDKTHPALAEMPEGSKRDILVTYMDHTRGLWIRTLELAADKNGGQAVGDVELWYDGVFQCSWGGGMDAADLALVVGRAAIEIGEKKAKSDIRAMLGCK